MAVQLTNMGDLAKAALKKTALWPGCDLWPDLKKENLQALMEVALKYGNP